MRLIVRRQGQTLVPINATMAQEMERLPQDRWLTAEVKRPRNIERHALWWVMCTALAQGLNAAPGKRSWTPEMVSDRLKIATGRAEIVPLPPALAERWGTSAAVRPASIAFNKMDENEFRALLDDAWSYIAEAFGPALEHQAFADVRAILGGERKRKEDNV